MIITYRMKDNRHTDGYKWITKEVESGKLSTNENIQYMQCKELIPTKQRKNIKAIWVGNNCIWDDTDI